jgi:peptidoglycan/xylan/chitin deacetylase (PgdA/CDA1 family)
MPTNLVGTTGPNGGAHVSWSFGTGGTSATHSYRIYRNGMAIANVLSPSTSFDEYRAGLKAAGYDYSVQAVDINGYTSAMTAAVHVDVLPEQYPWAGTLYYSGAATSNAVALTFDDCYNGEVVARIAAILRANHAPATFFCTGQGMVENVNLISDIARDFPVGNHTYDHPDLNTLTEASVFGELITATNKIEAATGQPLPPIMRPPYGHANAYVRGDCKLLGLAVVRWNIDTNDWRNTQTASAVLAAALEAKPGNIVLMHDKTKTADVLAQIISGLRAKGYRLATVPELLGIPWLAAETDY